MKYIQYSISTRDSHQNSSWSPWKMCILLRVQFCRTLATQHLLNLRAQCFLGRLSWKALRSLNSECCKYLVISALITVHGWLGSLDASNQISELLEYSACNGLGGVFTLNRPCSYNLLIKNAVMIRIRKLNCTLYIWSLCGVPSFRDWNQAQNDLSAVPNLPTTTAKMLILSPWFGNKIL